VRGFWRKIAHGGVRWKLREGGGAREVEAREFVGDGRKRRRWAIGGFLEAMGAGSFMKGEGYRWMARVKLLEGNLRPMERERSRLPPFLAKGFFSSLSKKVVKGEFFGKSF
jgi:hypothetical protein